MSIQMMNKLVGVPWDPTGVVRARADGGHHDGGYVISGQTSSEVGLPVTREQTPRRMCITCDLIRQYGSTAGCPKCRSVARGDSISQTLPHPRACRERIEGLVGHDTLPHDRLSRAVERRATWQNTLRKSLVHGAVELLPQHQALTAPMCKTCRTRRRAVQTVWCHRRAMSQVWTSVLLPWRNVPGPGTPNMIQVKFRFQQRTEIKC